MRRAADVSLGIALVGAVLVFLVPGGLWSDVPGWTLLVVGAVGEIAFTALWFVSGAPGAWWKT